MVSNFFKPKQVTGVHTVYVLTPLGKEKAEKFSESNPYCEVFSQLDQSPQSVNEIAKETRMNPKKVKLIVDNMVRSGYARKAPVSGE